MNYGGFWLRVVAYLIDFVILMIVQFALVFAFGDTVTDTSATGFSANTESTSPLLNIVLIILGVAYFAGFESSAKQATPGKSALGLVVTDLDGRKITPLRAVGRYFAKIVSGMILFIGFIMVAFTGRKQGLHDLICSTLVLQAKPGETHVDTEVFE
ncbi:RDD family protein [Erythrobacter sp. SCSIO 43205]|uniref:RDD family protein n=1 Tax=Erythrobacter sp. SCSIO 43205 TaxID=2779361 RepID=UPI001CA98B1F|nr:RDD family protein [Erythrobacter sp. SCSIO 43205]UAB77593.1 RDD family protein [Erythrobacter sp. SCSIO 43205]